jgi:hypothetical protein
MMKILFYFYQCMPPAKNPSDGTRVLQPTFNGTTGSEQKNLCEEGVGKISKVLFFVTKQGVSLVNSLI